MAKPTRIIHQTDPDLRPGADVAALFVRFFRPELEKAAREGRLGCAAKPQPPPKKKPAKE